MKNNIDSNCLRLWHGTRGTDPQVLINGDGLNINYDKAREIVYGMPYPEWKSKYQKEATPEQQAAFEKRRG